MKQQTHKAHTQPIVTEKFGPHLDSQKMQNNTFRAAYHGGHELNESYKMPVPNASGVNHSYIRPGLGGAEISKANKMPAGPIKTGKNTSH